MPDGQGDAIRNKLLGFGDSSVHKSYYPQLRKRLEELELVVALLDCANDLILLIDTASGRIRNANQAACKRLGFTKKQVGELAFLDMFMTGEGQGRQHLAPQALTAFGVYEVSLAAEDPPRVFFELTVSVVSVGASSYAVGVARDITQRKAAKNELDAIRMALQSILDSMPSVVVGVDAHKKVIYWNLAAANMTGILQEQARDKPLGEVLPQIDPYGEVLDDTLQNAISFTRLLTVGNPDSHPRHQELQASPLRGAQGNVGAVIRLDDVTERERMQEMMLQAEKMMSVGGLAAGMAHEINNPLAGILQNAQNLERRLMADLPANLDTAQSLGVSLESVRRYAQARDIPALLQTIKQSGERAARIVSNMLNFSRPGTSARTSVSLAHVADKVLEIVSSDYNLHKKYDFRAITICREFQPDMPAVPCTQGEIEQVLFNLLQNAAQALCSAPAGCQTRVKRRQACEVAPLTSSAGQPLQAVDAGGGRQTCEDGQLPCIVLRIRCEGDQALVEVEDNGPGMDEALRRRIFEPFVTTKQPGEGTGLGLSVAYFIVTRNHHGAFEVYSEPGKGARFVVRLPLASQPDAG